MEIHNGRIDSSDVYFDFLDLTVTTEKEAADTIAPVISFPENTVLMVGDVFDPMAGVSASDNVDGDITAAVQVQRQVDTSSGHRRTGLYSYRQGRKQRGSCSKGNR